MYNKRGQGLSTNAIILIVLGIIVLAVLVIGFTLGWDKIIPWISTSNVDTIATQCSIACSTGSTYDYCSLEREIKFKGEITGLTSGGKYTCNELSQFSTLGIASCPGIACPKQVEGKTYTWVLSLNVCNVDMEGKVVSNSYCDQATKGINGKSICCETAA